ncbi:UNVERIFIED_CONTAM: Xyloglucan galactosyltransferase XLT2 [Sesamum radiatum]|uniref:Xyloglucan galactosyltransferase XLT2 n=1 Tax=Sesamum radiatum TaxID=300843 RepID=A0AAW2KL79_SESRA
MADRHRPPPAPNYPLPQPGFSVAPSPLPTAVTSSPPPPPPPPSTTKPANTAAYMSTISPHVQQRPPRQLPRLRPLELPLQRRLQRRIRASGHRTRGSCPGEPHPSLVLDRYVRRGSHIPRENDELQMPNTESGPSDGVLHPLLRRPRRREVSLVQLHVKRSRLPQRGDAEMGQDPAALQELKRVGSFHHAGSPHLGLPQINRQRRRVGDQIHLHAIDEKCSSSSSGEKSMGPARNQRTLPDSIPPEIRTRHPPMAELHPRQKTGQPIYFRWGDPEEDPERLPRSTNGLLQKRIELMPSGRCSITHCYDGAPAILEAFLDSDFCLQPKGDGFTRRSAFDCMLAGSIPVYFWRGSTEYQYEWHLPKLAQTYSVFIDHNVVRNDTSIIKQVLQKL